MRDQLIRYVDLLFAGASGTADIKQEILQNTLDRYDDLVAQGKSPQAAYSLAISGIGDLSEILAREPEVSVPVSAVPTTTEAAERPRWKKILRAIAIFLYIICIIPLIVLDEMGMDTIGLVATISIVAVATVAILVSGDDTPDAEEPKKEENLTPRQELRKATKKAISTAGLVIYLIVSFVTQAWYITWVIFPMISAVWGIVNAVLDLKEAK